MCWQVEWVAEEFKGSFANLLPNRAGVVAAAIAAAQRTETCQVLLNEELKLALGLRPENGQV